MTITYAQNREDIILEGFFPGEEKGFYVDIGGYDPDYDSVTKLFYMKGWNGISVEPQADRFQAFVKKRPRDININAGISNKPGQLVLRSYKNQGLSTFSDEMKNDYTHLSSDQTEEYQDVKVKVITLKQLLQENRIKSIQFMKVDVEGLEYEVLDGNDWKKYRPEVICIEANHIKKDWRPLLTKNDYSLSFFDGLNNYYTDNHSKAASRFDYVTAVVNREPIVQVGVAKELQTRDKAVAWQDATIKLQRTELGALGAHAENLQSRLDEISSLRKHLKRSVRFRAGRLDRKIERTLTPKRRFRPKSSLTPTSSMKNAKELMKAAHKDDTNNFLRFNKPLIKNPVHILYTKTRDTGLTSARKFRRRGPKA